MSKLITLDNLKSALTKFKENLSPSLTKLDSITGVVTADKLHNPDHPTDLVAYNAFQAAVPLVQGMNLTGATVGQTIKVKAVNEQGMPTAWEAAEMAGGGVDKNLRWAQVLEMTTTEQMNIITADKDPEGRTFASYNAIAMLTVLSIPADSTQTSPSGTVWVTAQPIGYNSRASLNIANWKTNSRTISQCHLGTAGGLVWCGLSNSGSMTSTNHIDNIFTVVKIEVHNADDHLPIGTTVRVFLLSEENA